MTRLASTMLKKVEQYVIHKRSMGYIFKTDSKHLRSFAHYADRHAPGQSLTVDLALRWATAPKGTARSYHARRLTVLRTFARYLAIFDSRTEIPPQRLLGPSVQRVPPHLYTPQEITALIQKSLTYRPSLRHDPYTGLRNATVIGLLACTGLRVGEALAFQSRDVDLTQGLLTVRCSKNLPMRLVPITSCTIDHLRQYQEARDKRFGPSGDTDAFFRSLRGGNVAYVTMKVAFRRLCQRIGLQKAWGRNPRLRELRHTFASNHLLRAYREHRDIDNAVHDLSIYLGHANLAHTYWYISAVPALLEHSVNRFKAHTRQPQKGGRS